MDGDSYTFTMRGILATNEFQDSNSFVISFSTDCTDFDLTSSDLSSSQMTYDIASTAQTVTVSNKNSKDCYLSVFTVLQSNGNALPASIVFDPTTKVITVYSTDPSQAGAYTVDVQLSYQGIGAVVTSR